MSTYQLTSSTSILRTADNACIPADPANRDYADYLSWAAAGNTADPYVAPPPPPAQFLPQDLMAQFAPADMVKITAAINADATGQVQLLWFAMVAQRDPMVVTNPRVLAGWSALVTVLGQDRMNAIATALAVPSLVVTNGA